MNAYRYCTQGLERFLCGDYAWAMPEGLMLGYVRQSHSVPTSLSPYLAENKQAFEVQSMPQQRPTDPPTRWPAFLSVHRRRFVPSGSSQPYPIEVGHIWLELDG